MYPESLPSEPEPHLEITPSRLRPSLARGRWVVLALAIALTLAGLASLEVLHRAEVTEMLGHPRHDWANSQLRALATGHACALLDLTDRMEAILSPLLNTSPPNEIAAAAAHELASIDLKASRSEQQEYSRRAVLLVPDESPRLYLYYISCMLAFNAPQDTEELEKILRLGMERRIDIRTRARLLLALVGVQKRQNPTRARQTLEESLKRWPDLGSRPETQRSLHRRTVSPSTSPELMRPGH